jgi:hypothetical protein
MKRNRGLKRKKKRVRSKTRSKRRERARIIPKSREIRMFPFEAGC